MTILDKISENLLGLSFDNQIELLQIIHETINELQDKDLENFFKMIFLPHQEKLTMLLEFKDNYQRHNSDLRRIIRKTALTNIIDVISYHHIDNSEEREKGHFLYTSEELTSYNRTLEYKRFFMPTEIEESEYEYFKYYYSKLTPSQKKQFIQSMLEKYNRLRNYVFSLAGYKKMNEEYRPLITSIIGEDMMQYYDQLFPKEQFNLIRKTVDDTAYILEENEYYTSLLVESKNNPTLIRQLKKRVESESGFFLT